MDRSIPQFVPYWSREETDAVTRILVESDYLNEHKTVRSFEESFARFVGAKYCMAVPSGTTALYCAVNALNLQEKGPVSVPSHDGIFAFNALVAAGGLPEVCDVNSSGLLDASRTGDHGDREGIVVHANGRISDDISLIEDCSQATFHHTRDMVSTYSFASTKHMTTGGQGGAVCCDDAGIFDALTRIKDHGRSDRQHLKPMSDNYDVWGMNFKMTEIQAAFGLVQLRGMDRRMRRLHEMYLLYRDLLSSKFRFDGDEPRWYVDVFVPDPARIRQRLARSGIHCRPYPRPLHRQKVAAGHLGGRTFAMAEKRYRSGLYLPSTTNLSDEDIKQIAVELLDAID